MIKGILFDMDGVIVDSEVVYADMLKDMLYDENVCISIQEARSLSGVDAYETYHFVAKKMNVSFDIAKKRLDDFYNHTPVDYKEILRPEIVEILKSIKANHMKTALVSSSSKKTIKSVVDNCKLEGYFDLWISGDEFIQSKPAPEIYLTALEHLGIRSTQALAVEDSKCGVMSAVGANIWTIGLEDERIVQDLSLSNIKIKNLTDIYNILEIINKPTM